MLGFGVHWPILPFSGRFSSDVAMSGPTGFVLLDFLQGRWAAWGDAASHLVLPVALALGFSPLIVRVRASLLKPATNNTCPSRAMSPAARDSAACCATRFLPADLIGVRFDFLIWRHPADRDDFSFPGMGNMMVQAVRNHDLPLIQNISLVFAR